MSCNPNLPTFRPPPPFPDILGGRTPTAVLFHGEPLLIARELGEALGYSDRGKRFVTKITGKWSDELLEGRDYHLVQPDGGAGDVVVIGGGPDSVPLNPRGTVCLTARGARLAPFLGRTQKSKEARKHLVDVILPWYEEQVQRHAAGATPPPSTTAPNLAQRRLTVREKREQRLAAQAQAKLVDALEAAGKISAAEAGKKRLAILEGLGGSPQPSTPTPAPPAPPTQQRLQLTAHGFESDEWLTVKQLGQLLLVRFDEALEFEHHAGAALRIGRRPFGLDLLGFVHGLLQQGCIAQCHFGLDFARGRVPDLVLAGSGTSGTTGDEMVNLTHGGILSFLANGCGKRMLRNQPVSDETFAFRDYPTAAIICAHRIAP